MADPVMIHPSTLNRLVCRLQYHWSRDYKPVHTNSRLDFGGAIHKALEAYYDPANKGKRPLPTKVFRDNWRDSNVYMEGYGDDSLDLGINMMDNYFAHYDGKEPFDVWYTEKEVARRIPIPDDDPNPPARAKKFYVAARVDAIVWDRTLAKMFVLEHKTFEKFYAGSLELDHQFVIEKFVAEGLTAGPVDGVIYNGLRKVAHPSKTTKLFERHILYINDEQVKVALHRAYWSLMMVTDPNFKIYPEPATMKCNFCEFKQPCVEYQHGRDYQFILDNIFERRGEEDTEWDL